jgi:glycosyltransferase involved in cell wall biosynthesis
LLEAAACARPIVASDVPGCRAAVCTGESESAILVAPRDVNALADAIAALVGDPLRRQTMGGNGRALIAAGFTEEVVAQETLALYREALANRAAPS